MAFELKTLGDQLQTKLSSVANALPKDFNEQRFTQNSLALLSEHPELTKYGAGQVMLGLLKGAYLGLDFMNKECYLIAYNNQLQFQTDYKGEIKFTKKYSIRPIKDIYAKVVREGDEFEEKITDGQLSVDFRPLPFNGNAIVGAFAVVLYADGGIECETMSVDDINAVRNNYSKAANSKAWKNSFDEMAKKTVLRRLCKHIECDFESVEIRKTWDEASGMDFTDNTVKAPKKPTVDVFADEDIVEGEVVENGNTDEN